MEADEGAPTEWRLLEGRLWPVKFIWEANVPTGGSRLIAEPEGYDGHPTPAGFRMDYSPRFATSGRLAVAAVLAFRPFISGTVSFPGAISPELARSITEFLQPTTIFAGPLELAPKPLPLGSGTLVVQDAGGAVADVQPTARTTASRVLLRSAATTFGTHIEADMVEVPTNASSLVPVGGTRFDALLPHLAPVVLMAEDFGSGTVRLPVFARDSPKRPALADLLQMTGLALAFDE